MQNGSALYVFDHDRGDLEALAVAAGFTRILTTKERPECDAEAANILLADREWKIALVHIDDRGWESLRRKMRKDTVLIRFSTQGFPPSIPDSTSGLCIRCLKKTSSLIASDLVLLKDIPSNHRTIESLQKRLVPDQFSTLVSFEEPHRLRALHILLQGVLAIWAVDPEICKNATARNLLGGVSTPVVPDRNFCRRGYLRKCLGLEESDSDSYRKQAGELCVTIAQELGIEELSDRPKIHQLISQVLEGPANECLDVDVVLESFPAIREFVERL